MGPLKKKKMEDFAKIIAYEDAEPSEAAYRVGYGRESHPVRDQYHINMASRLLRREDVQLRIHTLREQNSNKDKDFKTSMIDDLKRIIKFDVGQYYKSSNVTLNNGRTVTDYYLTKPIEEWKREDRCLMLTGFKNGEPQFIDKQWAWEKLLKIYELDGKNTADIEDLIGLMSSAGLPLTPPSTSSEKEEKEIEKELND